MIQTPQIPASGNLSRVRPVGDGYSVLWRTHGFRIPYLTPKKQMSDVYGGHLLFLCELQGFKPRSFAKQNCCFGGKTSRANGFAGREPKRGSESQSPGDIQASGGFFLFERSFLVLARRAGLGRRIAYACMLKAWFQTRWRAGTGGGKRFFEKSSLALAGTRYNVGGTCSKCTFLPRAEKYQKSRPREG